MTKLDDRWKHSPAPEAFTALKATRRWRENFINGLLTTEWFHWQIFIDVANQNHVFASYSKMQILKYFSAS